jgi:transposase, IS30 family
MHRPLELAVCHETIYKIVNACVWENVTPQTCLRSRQPRPPKRHHQPKKTGVIKPDAPHITSRSPAATARTEIGHWEGDLIIGKANKSAMITLAERQTGYAETIVLPHGYNAAIIAGALTTWTQSKPPVHLQSLTWDRGTEMAHWETLTEHTGLHIFFCDPHSPWQRPVNENLNSQLRWWFPKGTDLHNITQEQADNACHILNNQPRRAHNNLTAHTRYHQPCTHH